MFKKIFKAAKDLIKSPVGQIGIGLLLPGAGTFLSGVKGAGTMANLARGIGGFMQAQPMLTQAGIGLLAGDKPENVLRNVAYGSLARGIGAMGKPEGFMGGVKSGFGMTPSAGTGVNVPASSGGVQGGMSGSYGMNIAEEATKPGFLERFGLINPSGETFFDKYAPLLTLGQLGATVAAAALGEDQAKLLYDPNKNPYLASGREDEQDFYANINPYYSAATEAAGMKRGGVMDFPEKDGMINGPGNGQSDDIPAMLADGEFVMTKQAVMAAGDGDREKGTKKMYEMMYSLQDKAENMGIGKF